MNKEQQKNVAKYLRDALEDAQSKAPVGYGRYEFIFGYMQSVINDVSDALEGKPSLAPLYKKKGV